MSVSPMMWALLIDLLIDSGGWSSQFSCLSGVSVDWACERFSMASLRVLALLKQAGERFSSCTSWEGLWGWSFYGLASHEYFLVGLDMYKHHITSPTYRVRWSFDLILKGGLIYFGWSSRMLVTCYVVCSCPHSRMLVLARPTWDLSNCLSMLSSIFHSLLMDQRPRSRTKSICLRSCPTKRFWLSTL